MTKGLEFWFCVSKRCSSSYKEVTSVYNPTFSPQALDKRRITLYIVIRTLPGPQDVRTGGRSFMHENGDVLEKWTYPLQKLTLLDYPGRVACTIFTGGCDLRCPFCHNASLALPERERDVIKPRRAHGPSEKARGDPGRRGRDGGSRCSTQA